MFAGYAHFKVATEVINKKSPCCRDLQIHKLSPDSMGPKKKSGARKTEEDLGGEKEEEETEERGERRRKHRGNKKYIGAHVGIQGKAKCHYVRLSLSN